MTAQSQTSLGKLLQTSTCHVCAQRALTITSSLPTRTRESRPRRQACHKLCPNVWCVPKECAYQPNYPGGRMSTIHNKNYTIHKMCYMDAIQDAVHAQNYTIHKLYYMDAIQAVLQSCNPRLQIQGVCPSAQVAGC